jgi:hypothetical protein
VARQVLLVDVLPTILRTQGLPLPSSPAVAGRPLEHAFETNTGADPVERPAILATNHRKVVAYGVRTPVDKYVHHISPVDKELYLDLDRDPSEQAGPSASLGARAQVLRRIADDALTPSAFLYRLRVAGDDHYDLRIWTSGWIHSVDTVDLGPNEHARVEDGRQRLALKLRPQSGQPREVSVLLTPHGAPFWLDGTRGGRPLRPADIRIAGPRFPVSRVPFEFPEVERIAKVFSAPPGSVPGIDVWLEPVQGSPVPQISSTIEAQLRALGYLE